MFIRFEPEYNYGTMGQEPYTVRGDWFQITYDFIRDQNDNEIACYHPDHGLWEVFKTNIMYSDIVLGA